MSQVTLTSTFGFLQAGPSGPLLTLDNSQLTSGSLYLTGTYTNVPLTQGHGTGAQATVVVSGGVVTSATITANGTGYVTGDTLSASNSDLGGSGSGFSIVAETVGIPGPPPPSPPFSLWSVVDPSFFSSNFSGDALVGIAQGSSTSLVVISYNGNAAFTSDGGSTWTYVPKFAASPYYIENLIYGNGTYLVTWNSQGNTNPVYVSTTGATWATPSNFDGAHLFGTFFSTTLDKFISFDTYYSLAWSSSDGNTWTSSATGPFNGLAYNAGGDLLEVFDVQYQYYAFAENGTSVIVPGYFSGNGTLGAANTAGVLLTTDGVTWTMPFTAPAGMYPYGASYNGSQFIAVFTDYSNTYAYTSTDGTTWVETSSSAGYDTAPFQGEIISSNGYFVSSFNGTDGKSIAKSLDGITWTDVTVTTPDDSYFYPHNISADSTTLYEFFYGLISSTDLSTFTVQIGQISGTVNQVNTDVAGTYAVGSDESGNGILWKKP